LLDQRRSRSDNQAPEWFGKYGPSAKSSSPRSSCSSRYQEVNKIKVGK